MNYLFTAPISKSGTLGLAFPIGCACVAAALRGKGFSVFGFNPNFSNDPEKDFLKSIAENNIDVVCIGAMSTYYPEVEAMIRAAKAIKKPGGGGMCTVVLGGSLVSTEPEAVMGSIGADYGVVGQGEMTMIELAEALESAGDGKKRNFDALPSINGLVFLDRGGEVHVNKPRADIKDLDAMPMPAYDLFNISEYIDRTGMLPISASRSCPYKCTFCHHSSGLKYTARSLDSVFAEIDYWRRDYEIKILYIIDELFTVNKRRVSEFCDRVKEYGIQISIMAHANTLNDEIVKKLKEAGCYLIGIGIESADDRVLTSMKKHVTFRQIENALELGRKHGIKIYGNFIFGDIEETPETVETTLSWWRGHPEYDINLMMIRVLPGSHLFEVAKRRALVSDVAVFLRNSCPIINVSKLTAQQFRALNDECTRLMDERLLFSKNVSIEKIYDDDSCQVSAVCPHCDAKNSYMIPDINAKQAVLCRTCGERMNMDHRELIGKDALIGVLRLRLNERFQAYADHGERILIYGTGEIAKALVMYSRNMRKCLAGFSGADYGGFGEAGLLGFPVFKPEDIPKSGADHVLIASVRYAPEIRQYIKEDLRLDIPVMAL